MICLIFWRNEKPFEIKAPLVKVLFYEDFFLTALDADATFILEMCCICVEQVEKACIQLEKMSLKSFFGYNGGFECLYYFKINPVLST